MAFLHNLVNFLLTTHPPSVQMTPILYEKEYNNLNMANLYKEKSYSVMKPLLYLKTDYDEISISEIVAMIRYFVASELCTKEDLISLIGFVNMYRDTSLFKQYSMLEQLVQEYGFATNYAYALSEYGLIEDVREEGMATMSNVLHYSEILNDPLHFSDAYNSTMQYFENYSPDMSEQEYTIDELQRSIIFTFPSYEE